MEQAILLNGVAVEMNISAFRWGRRSAHDPGALASLVAERTDTVCDGKPTREENKLYYWLRGGVYTFKVGVARTHELWVRVLAGRPDPDKLGRFFRAAEEPLLATCEPAHVAATKALGPHATAETPAPAPQGRRRSPAGG